MNAISTASGQRTSRRVTAPVLAAACALALAACGSSHSSGTSADPATIVPASAPVFAGAAVRPGGKLKHAALSAGQALTHRSSPYSGLLGALRTPGSPPLNYGRDVAPWLGPHAGAFVTSPGGAEALAGLLLAGAGQISSFPFLPGGPQGAVILDTSDASRAESFLNAAATRAGAHQTSYRGIAYRTTARGLAFALVKRFAVIGTEAALRTVIDTAQGGPSLAQSSSYSKLSRNASQQALARLYLAAGANAVAGASSAPAGGARGALALLAPAGASLTSVVPGERSLTVDLDALAAGGAGGLFEAAPQGAQAFGELPGESWLALGIGKAQGRLRADIQGLGTLLGASGSAGEGALGLQSLLGSLLKPLQALAAPTRAARADFASWMGPVGVFASGANLLELKGAIVIDSLEAARSRAAVAKLAAVLHGQGASVQPLALAGTEAAAQVRLSGLPLALVIAAGRNAAGQPKFVLALGQSSVALALNPPSTMSTSARARAAAQALGEGINPSLVLDVPTLLALIEGLGLTESGGLSGVVPYLRGATTLSGGAVALNGSVERVKLVLGLAGSGAS